MGTTFSDDKVVANTFSNFDLDFQREYLVKNMNSHFQRAALATTLGHG